MGVGRERDHRGGRRRRRAKLCKVERYERMRSSLVVRASDCQCTSCNGPGFDPRIRRHSGILKYKKKDRVLYIPTSVG
jgi:hypothetical protein